MQEEAVVDALQLPLAHIIRKLKEGKWKRVLFVPTGALLSQVSFNEILSPESPMLLWWKQSSIGRS